MELILIAVVLWWLGDAIQNFSRAGQSLFDYWALKERERIRRESED